MPLFRKNLMQEQQYTGTITTIPRYEDMMKILGDWARSEFKLEERVVPVLGINFDGMAIDDKQISMLAPTPTNFVLPSDREYISLDSLNIGAHEDGEAIVGFSKTVVRKKYVDAFVHAMKDVYDVKWQEIHVLVHSKVASPLFLSSNLWTFAVAPIVDKRLDGRKAGYWESMLWAKGKYDPEAEKIHHGNSCKDCAYSNGYLVESQKPSFSMLLGISEYELKEHWSCIKFSFNLDGRLGLAEKCTGYLTQEDYEQKCLSGEIEPFKPATVVDCAYCGGSYDMIQNPRCPNCGATQKKKLK